MHLDDVLARLNDLPADAKASAVQTAVDQTSALVWVPNPGPQTEAYFCEADELFYGGQAGGGKSDLIVGLALTEHQRSLILRRVNKDILSLVDRTAEVLGTRQGYNGQDKVWRTGGRSIEFGGCQLEGDKERYKGRPHDLKAFDEISDFTESQYTFIIGWNRSAAAGQRCRVVATGNPPTRPEGLWVLKRWAAWLDPKHPNPAKPGELRWYTTSDDGVEREVDGPGPHVIGGTSVFARSRTFIPARVSDNPDLMEAGYQAMLDALPPELRSAYRDGNFHAEIKDDDFQLIPTAWIKAAMERWTPEGWKNLAMTAMAVDPAGGGADAAEIACRYGGWYAPLVTIKGPETADGSVMAGRVVGHRRDSCPVIVDSGGGYGGAISQRLRDNSINAVAFNGANASIARTRDKAKLAFVNKRAEVWWRFREELNPDQQGGSVIALPPDDELKADLAAPHWELTARGIKIEAKEDIKKRIGRSPGKGDAVVMALTEGNAAIKREKRSGGQLPPVNIGYSNLKRRP